MKTYCFTIDDNVKFLKEITEQNFQSIFEHPYLHMLYRLHERFGVKIQLNMFYKMDGFNLSEMSDKYIDQWQKASDWLKLSFHSEYENVRPYESSGYDEVFSHCNAVHNEIVRFASQFSLAKTTTVHYCQARKDGVKALFDNGVRGLLGLFGNANSPATSYSIDEQNASSIRNGRIVSLDGIAFASIDMIINTVKKDDILPTLDKLSKRDSLRVMIHEQYFYKDYKAYQPDFEEKLVTVFTWLQSNDYESRFFEEII